MSPPVAYGSQPIAIALEAQSAAHQLAETLADSRRSQAQVNIDVRRTLEGMEQRLTQILVELGEIRGEARAAARQSKASAMWLGLAVAGIELLSHLPWDRIVGAR